MARRESNPFYYETYVLRIEGWKPTYSFSIGGPFRNEGPYREFSEIVVQAVFLLPIKLEGKAVKINLIGRRELDDALDSPSDTGVDPLAIGGLTVRGDRRELLGSVPLTSMWQILGALDAEYFKYIQLDGERFRYGSAKIRSAHFLNDVNLEDY